MQLCRNETWYRKTNTRQQCTVVIKLSQSPRTLLSSRKSVISKIQTFLQDMLNSSKKKAQMEMDQLRVSSNSKCTDLSLYNQKQLIWVSTGPSASLQYNEAL